VCLRMGCQCSKDTVASAPAAASVAEAATSAGTALASNEAKPNQQTMDAAPAPAVERVPSPAKDIVEATSQPQNLAAPAGITSAPVAAAPAGSAEGSEIAPRTQSGSYEDAVEESMNPPPEAYHSADSEEPQAAQKAKTEQARPKKNNNQRPKKKNTKRN
jgi:hypothetical protein